MRKVTVHTDLSTSVTVCGMPAKHVRCNLEGMPLKMYLSELDQLHACTGITNPQFQQYANIPTSTHNSAVKHFCMQRIHFTQQNLVVQHVYDLNSVSSYVK